MTCDQTITSLSDCRPPYFFGVDVGGTNIKIGLVDDSGKTFGFDSIETDEPKGPADAVERIVVAMSGLVKPLGLSLSDFARIGLGTPGSQNIKTGMLINPPNHPHWWNFPIVACLEKASGLPVSFANDANAAAFGEYWIGTGEKHSSMALLTLGTGVGGGIITDSHLIVGANSFGAECGHIIVDSSPTARLCTWGGGKGHLEAYASASAVVAIAKERLNKGAVSLLAGSQESIGKITSKKIYEAAVANDPFAIQLIDETAYYLGIGITNIVHTVDPGLVVLGGAMNFGGRASPVGLRFLERIRAAFCELSFDYVESGTTIDFAILGGDAGFLGAAGIARQSFHRSVPA